MGVEEEKKSVTREDIAEDHHEEWKMLTERAISWSTVEI